ncbi:MAG: hypothetical protein MRZ79_14505 [Bacteroidia bacterium]|nr:hypothetical protein [Bacteroidia bacterium]
MHANFSLPPQSAEIFDRLSRGLFISRNTPNLPVSDLYQIIFRHFDDYKAYFKIIGFELEKGKDYFYFSKSETRGQTEEKAERLFKYLDGLEILYSLEPDLRPGSILMLEQHEEQLEKNRNLKKKSLKLPGKIGQEKAIDRLRSFCRSLEKESFMLDIDDRQTKYLVLDSFQYLVDFFTKIDQNS